MRDKLLSVVYGVALFVLILSFSIALPIYVRPFFYAQINALGLPARTGQSTEEIRTAFDELMDYLTLPGKSFGTGVFVNSADGAAHFADCKVLMTLNAVALLVSVAIVVTCCILRRKGYLHLSRPFGFEVGFTVGAGMLVSFLLIGILVAIDFDVAFTVFHKVFFPGKGNWVFYPDRDAIILIFPHAFFINCGALIAATIIIWSCVLIMLAVVRRYRVHRT